MNREQDRADNFIPYKNRVQVLIKSKDQMARAIARYPVQNPQWYRVTFITVDANSELVENVVEVEAADIEYVRHGKSK